MSLHSAVPFRSIPPGLRFMIVSAFVFSIMTLFVKIAAVIYGSSETTFYVIAVYFGAVNIRKTRHAVPAGLMADVSGVILAVFVVKWLL